MNADAPATSKRRCPSPDSRDLTMYREELPHDCPPHDAAEIVNETICYRLVNNEPPTDDDFRSQRALEPNRDFGVSECRARGLSVFLQAADATRIAQRSRNLRGARLARLTLNQGAGYIKQTGSRSHNTWWPYAAFDILANCEAMQ